MQMQMQEITPSFQPKQQFLPQEPHRMTTVHTPTVLEQRPQMHQAPVQQAPVQQAQSQQAQPVSGRTHRHFELELEHGKKNWRPEVRKFRRPDLQSSGWLMDRRHGSVVKPWMIDEFAHERGGFRNPIYSSNTVHRAAGNMRRIVQRG